MLLLAGAVYLIITFLTWTLMIGLSWQLETSALFLVFLYQSEMMLKFIIILTPKSALCNHALYLCNLRNKKSQLRLDLTDYRRRVDGVKSKEQLFYLVVSAHVLAFHKKINNMNFQLYIFVIAYKKINCKLNQIYRSLRFNNLPIVSGFPFEKSCLRYLQRCAPRNFLVTSGWFHSENRSGETDIVVFRIRNGIHYLVAVMECKLGHPDQKAYHQIRHKLLLAIRYKRFISDIGVINFRISKKLKMYILHGTPFLHKTPVIKIIIAGHRRKILQNMFGLRSGPIRINTNKVYGSLENRRYSPEEIIKVSKKDWYKTISISYYWHSKNKVIADKIFKQRVLE